MIAIEKASIYAAESESLMARLSQTLAFITGSSGQANFSTASLDTPGSLWALARNEAGKAVGCGGLRSLTANSAELKRMYSDQSEPGIGRALLTFLEASAKSLGYTALCLETRHVNQRAVRFYKAGGYALIDNYGPYAGRPEAVCFAKKL